MVQITTLRIWIAVSVVWPLFWALVFDRWFFFSPLGLFFALGIPIAGWAIWWKFYRGDEEKMVADGRLVLGKSVETLDKLKKHISSKDT